MIDNVVHNAPLGNSDRFAHRYIIFICTWYFIGKSVPKFINISLGQF
jgi:hypothetical protein